MNSQEFNVEKGESVVIYDASLVGKPGFNKKGLGYLLLNLSLSALLLFLTPILLAELSYWHRQATQPEINSTIITKDDALDGFGQLILLEESGAGSPEDWGFSLLIPALKLNTKVIPSVDPANKSEYEMALNTGVAHAQGSSFPDQQGTIYIFGHSTDFPWNIQNYNALFYPLKYLDSDDEIVIVYAGKSYLYTVKEKKIVNPEDLEYLYSEDESKRLVLQTCWPPGTDWQRLIIVAEPLKRA